MDWASVSKKELISNVNNVASNIVLHNSTNVLRKGQLGLSVIEKVGVIGEEAKSHARKYLKMMEEYINPVLHACVIIERVAAKVAEFRGVLLENKASKRCGNVSFKKSSASKGHKALKMPYKKYNISIV